MHQFPRQVAHLRTVRPLFGLAANDPTALRNWVVDITRADGSLRSEVIEARESWDAIDAADALEPTASRREVRPLIELTEREGRGRYPNPLHLQATAEANAGWLGRAERAALADLHNSVEKRYAYERNDRAALELQIQNNSQHRGFA